MELIIKLLPELILSVAIIASILSISIKDRGYYFFLILIFSLIFTTFSLISQLFLINQLGLDDISVFIGSVKIYEIGYFEIVSKILFSIISVLIIAICSVYFRDDNGNVGGYEHRYFKLEYGPLLLTVLLGAFVLVSASDLLTFLIGFELVSIPSYFVIALDNKNKIALEGSIKYFLIGSVSTISIILGILIFYIFNGSFSYEVNLSNLYLLSLKVAFLLIFVGVILKMGVFPFSFWIQDAYYASRTPYLLLISTLPKYAVVLALVKILFYLQTQYFKVLVPILSILSMIFGVYWALNQIDIKKLIAFSTVFNMGFALIPLVGFSGDLTNKAYILSLLNFYLFQYILSTVLVVGVLVYLEEKFDATDVIKLKGTLDKGGFLTSLFVVGLLSLAGLPPTVGFIAKFLVLAFSYKFNPFLVIVAIIFSVVSLYYYYRIAKELYVEKDSQITYTSDTWSLKNYLSYYTSMIIIGFLLIFFGLFPYFVTNVFYSLSLFFIGF